VLEIVFAVAVFLVVEGLEAVVVEL